MSPGARARKGVAALAVVATLTLAGCGGDQADPYAIPDRFQAYCDEVEAQQVVIGDALSTGGDATGLIKALPAFEALAAKAPDDIADEWQVVVDRVQELVDALDAAGVDPETYQRSKPPKGLTREQRGTIDAAATALASATTASAMGGVQQHARDVCKKPLTL